MHQSQWAHIQERRFGVGFFGLFALCRFVFNFCYQWAGFGSNAKGSLAKSFPTIPWEMEPFYFLKPILNHHCTLWWYPLYFRKLVLSSLSMPEKKVRSQDRRKEEKSREQRKIRKGTCRNQPHWWESFLGSSCLDTGRLCPFHHWIVMSDFDSVGPWKLHSE